MQFAIVSYNLFLFYCIIEGNYTFFAFFLRLVKTILASCILDHRYIHTEVGIPTYIHVFLWRVWYFKKLVKNVYLRSRLQKFKMKFFFNYGHSAFHSGMFTAGALVGWRARSGRDHGGCAHRWRAHWWRAQGWRAHGLEPCRQSIFLQVMIQTNLLFP